MSTIRLIVADFRVQFDRELVVRILESEFVADVVLT